MIPAILIILTIHIIIAIRWMLIKILSAVINDWERIKVIVPGGCYLDRIIIRKIDQKSRCCGTFDVRILPDRLETPAGMAGALCIYRNYRRMHIQRIYCYKVPSHYDLHIKGFNLRNEPFMEYPY